MVCKGGHDEVTGFGGLEGDLNGFAIAHFADENDFGRLAQSGAEGQRKRRRIAVEFALVNGGLLVLVQELDGVFDGKDVKGLVRVHFIDDGGERGRFSRSRGAGHQDDASLEVDDFFQLGREIQLFKAGNAVRNHAHHDGAASSLAKNIHTEAGDTGKSVGKIGGAFLLQFADGMLVLAHNVVGNQAGVFRTEALQTFEFQLARVRR